MKILDIKQFTTTEGTAKKTTLELDNRGGVYFKVVTPSYSTPLFTIKNTTVPVIMTHKDRSQYNVTIDITGTTLTIEQGYQQAEQGYLFSIVNDDWADTSEVQQVYIDASEIASVKLTTGITVDVDAVISGANVIIRSKEFTPNMSSYYAQVVITRDGKEYISVLTLDAHAISTEPIRYDYISVRTARILTAYIKP